MVHLTVTVAKVTKYTSSNTQCKNRLDLFNCFGIFTYRELKSSNFLCPPRAFKDHYKFNTPTQLVERYKTVQQLLTVYRPSRTSRGTSIMYLSVGRTFCQYSSSFTLRLRGGFTIQTRRSSLVVQNFTQRITTTVKPGFHYPS